MSLAKRRRVWIVNQVAGPLTLELVREMIALKWEVTVLAGELQGDAAMPKGARFAQSVRLRKQPSVARVWTWTAFAVHAAVCMLLARGPVVVYSNPPILMLVLPLLRRLTRKPYVLIVHDVYPDVMERMGLLRPGGLAAKLWRRLSARAQAAAASVLTIGERMGEQLNSHYPADRLTSVQVIPPWVDTEAIRPLPRRTNAFAIKHGLVNHVIVMYSGAFGATHGVGAIVESAARLRQVDGLHFVLIGGGTSEGSIRRSVRDKQLPNLTLLPWQPWREFPLSLACADCAIVALDGAYAGVSIPSKVFYAMASGAAVLALAPQNSELWRLVENGQCGICVIPGDSAGLDSAIRRLKEDPVQRVFYQTRARAIVCSDYSRQHLAPKQAAAVSRALLSGLPKAIPQASLGAGKRSGGGINR